MRRKKNWNIFNLLSKAKQEGNGTAGGMLDCRIMYGLGSQQHEALKFISPEKLFRAINESKAAETSLSRKVDEIQKILALKHKQAPLGLSEQNDHRKCFLSVSPEDFLLLFVTVGRWRKVERFRKKRRFQSCKEDRAGRIFYILSACCRKELAEELAIGSRPLT